MGRLETAAKKYKKVEILEDIAIASFQVPFMENFNMYLEFTTDAGKNPWTQNFRPDLASVRPVGLKAF